MNPILRNILAVIAGWIVGSIVNMGFIELGHAIVGLPEGSDISNMEGLKAAMENFESKHYIFPFIAHALGTLVGAYTAARIGVTNKKMLGLIVGVLFLLGGLYVAYTLPAPMWFNVIDLVFAYIPMALLAYKLVPSTKA